MKHLSFFLVVTSLFLLPCAYAQQDSFEEDQEESYDNEFEQENVDQNLEATAPNARTSQCDNLNSRIAAPKIRVNQESRSKISGTIEGVCIADAVYAEDGGRSQNISVTQLPQFKSFPFSITLHPGKGGEIRVNNSHGDSAEYTVESKNNDDDPLGIGVNPTNDD